ncbi:GHKL domain-containing protein [Faecalibacterium prausnitzii]|uniref:GHKL domain-containing protein n=1 Tax=Faecalibacterium prausnitzii TaxID=853 RepID=UPI003F1A110E
MKDILRPILELTVVFPGLLLAYFPVRSYLKQSSAKLAVWEVPLLFGLCLGGGLFCYHFGISTAFSVLLITLTAIFLYRRTLRLSLWKSGTIALAVCAVFACLNSLSRAVGTAITIRLQLPPDKPWFCFSACIFYNVICWLITAAAYYPATHAVRAMVEDDNFAQTWYVFWVLPLVFILLNLFITPRYQITLRTGRVLQVYIVMSIALLFLMFMFNAIFLLMATSLNRNARLQQENQLLSMQQQRYESLKAAIEEARQARHDMRHQLNQISALAEEGDLDNLKAYLAKTVSRIPDLDMNFCENRAADSVVGHYCALAKRENIPYSVQIDLPECLPVDEINLCLVLSNLLENALEASLRTAPARRRIELTAYLHGNSLALIQVENTYDGVIREKDGVFQSSKRKGEGVGIQSVRHIAEKTGGASTFTHQNGVFSAKVMLCGEKQPPETADSTTELYGKCGK